MDRYDAPFSGARLFTSSLLSKRSASTNNNSRSELSNLNVIGQTSGSLQTRSNIPSSGSILRPESWEALDKRLSSHTISKIQIPQPPNNDNYLINDRVASIDNPQGNHGRELLEYSVHGQSTALTPSARYTPLVTTQQHLVEEEIFRLSAELEAAKNKLASFSATNSQTSHIWADPPATRSSAAETSSDMHSVRQSTILSASARSEGFTDNSSPLSSSIGFGNLQIQAEGNSSQGAWEASNLLNDLSIGQKYKKANPSFFALSNNA